MIKEEPDIDNLTQLFDKNIRKPTSSSGGSSVPKTSTDLKWDKRKTNLEKLFTRITKNQEKYFKTKFTIVKLVYLIVKKANKINRWKIENKIESNKLGNKLNKSVAERIELIQKINKKIYENLLKNKSIENTKLKIWASLIQYKFINKKQFTNCYTEFKKKMMKKIILV